jgi:hypothetical protein
MDFCTRCGSPRAGASRFCTRCGGEFPVQPAATPTVPRRRHRAAVFAPLRLSLLVAVAAGIAAATVIIVATHRHHARPGRTVADSGVSASKRAFAGYPGQRGTVTVTSMASAGGTELAAGSADGHPAIWRRDVDGAWTLVTVGSRTVSIVSGALVGVAHGPQGWIAVGNAISPGATQPVVISSGDGVHWQAAAATFPGPGPVITGVAASQEGYVAVGTLQATYSREATWWSADMRHWSAGNDTNITLDGSKAASLMYGVVASPGAGFVAAGTDQAGSLCWVSANGQEWTEYPVAPAQGPAAVFTQVASGANGVTVAAGEATRTGDIPVLAFSTDGGQQWSPLIELVAPGGQGTVTALSQTAAGFIVAGQVGPAGARRAVTWNLPGSPDSSSWSAVSPVPSGVPEVTALAATGETVTGAGQQGQSATVVQLPGS